MNIHCQVAGPKRSLCRLLVHFRLCRFRFDRLRIGLGGGFEVDGGEGHFLKGGGFSQECIFIGKEGRNVSDFRRLNRLEGLA